MIELVKELLDSEQITQAVADKMNGGWKQHTKTLNDENKTLRENNEKLILEVDKSKSDLDAEILRLDEKIAQAKKDGQADIARELQEEKTSKAVLQKSYEDVQKTNASLKLDKVVADSLKEYDVKKSHKSNTEFMLRSKVTINDKGETVFKDGDNESSVADGFKGYFETNTDQLNPKGDGGSGAGEQGGGNHVVDTKDLSASQKMALGRSQQTK